MSEANLAPIASPGQLQVVRDELYALGEMEPRVAIERARLLQASPALEVAVKSLKAGVLIDVGQDASDGDAVREGVALLEKLVEAHPEEDTLRYNLGNGLIACASLDLTKGAAWFPATRTLRRQGRKRLASVRSADDSTLAAQALTNLGNALSRAHRWSEAFDAYVEALGQDPSHGVAAGCAAQLLLWRASRGGGDPRALHAVAIRYAKIARENRDRVLAIAGPASVAAFDKLPDGEAAPKLDLSGVKPYLRFVAEHHLALVPTIEGLDPRLRRWDSLLLPGVAEPLLDGAPTPPPLFAMFNSIKAGYLAVRRLAYRAISCRERQTGRYSDTLDYALYGTDVASLLLAQRAAIDVLDQIAVALNEYLSVGLSADKVTMRTIWGEDKNNVEWRPAIAAEIAAGNTAVVALGELAGDLSAGFLRSKLDARHASTHRFTVLHDEQMASWRESQAIEHRDYSGFVDEAIETLKAVRAAILYFVEIVVLREHRAHHEGPVLPLFAPLHHRIRADR